MRKAFISALCKQAKKNKKIFLITGDLGFNIIEPFRDQFPDRFLNIGVAEANLVTVAAGLSTTGFIPFIYSIATFSSLRPFEQIRNDVALQNLNVKIVGVGGGLAYAKAGPTHHSVEDIAIMRSLPNMTIISPADPEQAFQATEAAINFQGPMYLRFEHNPEGTIPPKKELFKVGMGYLIKKGKDLAIITTGAQLYTGLAVSSILDSKKISAAVFSFPTIKPLDVKLLLKILKEFKLIVTIEEHRINGGLGTAAAEFVIEQNNSHNVKLLRFGLKDIFTPISAEYNLLLKLHGLTPKQIVSSILKKRGLFK